MCAFWARVFGRRPGRSWCRAKTIATVRINTLNTTFWCPNQVPMLLRSLTVAPKTRREGTDTARRHGFLATAGLGSRSSRIPSIPKLGSITLAACNTWRPRSGCRKMFEFAAQGERGKTLARPGHEHSVPSTLSFSWLSYSVFRSCYLFLFHTSINEICFQAVPEVPTCMQIIKNWY